MYDRVNVKQMSIDNLPLRTHCKGSDKYYDKPMSTRHKHLHGFDLNDKSRQLATFTLRKHSPKFKEVAYYICKDGVYTHSAYVKKCRKESVKYTVNSNVIIVNNVPIGIVKFTTLPIANSLHKKMF